jgi:hypothetical protein
MPEIQGVKGEAIVSYAELLTTRELGYPRLSRRVNKTKKNESHISPIEEISAVRLRFSEQGITD